MGISRLIFFGLLASLAAAGCRAVSAGDREDRVWCSFTDGKCSQWPEAAVPAGDAALIKKIEAKSRAVYIEVFTRNKNPAGLEAAKLLREHPEISFKTGLYREDTAVNWCLGEERAVYTDIRSLKKRWTLDELAGDEEIYRNFVEGNAPFIAHELVHMLAFYKRLDLRNGAVAPDVDPASPDWVLSQALKSLPVTTVKAPPAELNDRYRMAEEYLSYLVEQSYVGFELLKNAKYISSKGAWGVKWRWDYYAKDPEKYCQGVLHTSCSHAGLEDIKAPVYPEMYEYYKSNISRQKKIRAEILSRLKK